LGAAVTTDSLPTPAEVAKEKRDHVERLLKTPEGDKPHPDNLKDVWLDEDKACLFGHQPRYKILQCYLANIRKPESSHSPKDYFLIIKNRRLSATLPAVS